MGNNKDWRLNGQEAYLQGVKLCFREYDISREHDHCKFCWDKFSGDEDSLHAGYVTEDGKRWICPACFNDFKEMFAWTVVEKIK